jgi:hypothetical protein
VVEGLSTLELAGLIAAGFGIPIGVGKSMQMLAQAVALGKASHRRQDDFEKEVREDMLKAAEERGRRAADNEAVHRDLRDLKEALGKGFASIRDDVSKQISRMDLRLDRRRGDE